jgi:hypothetical protein
VDNSLSEQNAQVVSRKDFSGISDQLLIRDQSDATATT